MNGSYQLDKKKSGNRLFNNSGRKRLLLSKDWKRQGAFLTMVIPGLIILIVFAYLPMPGIILALKRYTLQIPPADSWIQNRFVYSLINSPWVGLDNFKFMFTTPDAWIIFRNTIGYSLLFNVIGLFTSVGLAIMINELKQRFIAKTYHTLIFVPFFISWIVVSYIIYALFSQQTGLINSLLDRLGRDPVAWYAQSQYWPFIFVISNIWRYTGNSSIIYLSTMTGFDQQLYEAAAIDGANKRQQLTKITLPLLKPTIVLLQILAVGRIFNSDFDMFFQLPNGSGALRNVSLTIDVYVFNTMRTGAQLGLSAAAGLFQAVVGFVLVLGTNLVVRRTASDMALF